MPKFETHAVLSCSTGRLFGDIGGVYKVMSYMLGRDAYTHEIAYYGKRGAAALRAALPALPGEEDVEHVNRDNFREVLAEWEAKLGAEIELGDALRECLADDKDGLETLRAMVPEEKIIVVDPRG